MYLIKRILLKTEPLKQPHKDTNWIIRFEHPQTVNISLLDCIFKVLLEKTVDIVRHLVDVLIDHAVFIVKLVRYILNE